MKEKILTSDHEDQYGFKPLSDNVLIDYEDKDEEKTKGGIIMTTRERPQQGIASTTGVGLL